jgi:hypothetical protein
VVISGEFIVNLMGSHGNLLAFAGIWMGHIWCITYGYDLWTIETCQQHYTMENRSKCRTINHFWEATNIWLWQ